MFQSLHAAATPRPLRAAYSLVRLAVSTGDRYLVDKYSSRSLGSDHLAVVPLTAVEADIERDVTTVGVILSADGMLRRSIDPGLQVTAGIRTELIASHP